MTWVKKNIFFNTRRDRHLHQRVFPTIINRHRSTIAGVGNLQFFVRSRKSSLCALGVARYAAPAKEQIDAEMAEKGGFLTATDN
jgi:hypothetical protein